MKVDVTATKITGARTRGQLQQMPTSDLNAIVNMIMPG
jgi:hypothetical protein